MEYKHDRDDDRLRIQVKTLYGLFRYKWEIPSVKVMYEKPSIEFEERKAFEQKEQSKKMDKKTIDQDDVLTFIHNFKKMVEQVVHFKEIMEKFFKKVQIKQLEWISVIGSGDAALTGFLTGVAWGIKGGVMGIISHFFSLQTTPSITILPDFHQKVSKTHFICMIQFRIGQAIFASIKFFINRRGHRSKRSQKHIAKQNIRHNEGGVS